MHFPVPPLIKIRNQHVGAKLGGRAVLRCYIEVYPTAVNYWIRGDGIPIDPSWKYKMNETTEGYKVQFRILHFISEVLRCHGND